MRGDGFLSFPLFPKTASIPSTLLALLVVAASVLMVVPLPIWLVDLCLAANLTFSLLVLLVALSARNVTRLASFPALFLIATLLRLALTVATSRLILLHADAGRVVAAFGHFIIQNNYVAGTILLLTLIVAQFVVVAKGSERCAEVAARFALDGLPGRQMAIDADLRSAAISSSEARRRREALASESQFYGAMDGAMKFIKGDVVASWIVIVVNLTGGVGIGVLQHGLTLTDAVRRYGLLTLGAAFVTQLAALAVGTAGGILVTRAGDSAESPLGEQFAAHLFRSPGAIAAAGFVALVLALLPGLPALPFALVGAACVGLTWAQHRRSSGTTADAASELEQAAEPDGSSVIPWSFEVGPDLRHWVGARGALTERLRALRSEISRDLGLPLPDCVTRVDPKLPARSAVLSLREIPARIIDTRAQLTDEALLLLFSDQAEACLRAHAADFIGLSETQRMLDRLERHDPETVHRLIPSPIRLASLTEILRRLTAEGVSVRDLRSILEALAQAPAEHRDPGCLADFVRIRLRRQISHQLTRGSSSLDVIVLEPLVEDTLRAALGYGTDELRLAPAAARDLLLAVRRAFDQGAAAASPAVPAVLTAPDVRRGLRQLLISDFRTLPVIAPGELLPEIEIKPVATVSLRGI